MFMALKTFFAGNQIAMYGLIVALIFGVGVYTGTSIQYTVERSREALANRKSEDARKLLADQLQATVTQLEAVQESLRRKQAALKVKVDNEVKNNPAYRCPLPASAVQLLNQ